MMKKNRFYRIAVLAAVGYILLQNTVLAEKVTGYNHLYAMLVTEGANQTDEIKDIINEAQKEVISMQKRYKKVTFGNPIEVHFFNSIYIGISFQAKIFTTTIPNDAVFSMLFRRQGESNLEFQNEFLIWVGKKGVTEYFTFNKQQICQHYHELLGRDVCVEAVQTAKQKPTVPRHIHNMSDVRLGTIREDFIDKSIARVNWVENELKKKADLNHSHKEFSDIGKDKGGGADSKEVANLKSEIVQLQKTVQQLQALLRGVSRKGNDIVFSNVNVQIVNGSGKTDGPVNGRGNLIIGYNESSERGAAIVRTGSHNIVVGSKNGYSSYGGIVTGVSNTISGRYSSVNGGSGNIAKGDYSSVSGGHLNVSKGNYSNVSGGLSRTSTESNSWRGGEYTSPQ